MAGITDFAGPTTRRRALYSFNLTNGGEFQFQLARPIPNVTAIRFRSLVYRNSNGANGGTDPWDGLILAVDGFQGDSYYVVPLANAALVNTTPNYMQGHIVLPLVPSVGNTNVLTWGSEEFPHIIPATPITVDNLRVRVYLQYGANFPQLATDADINTTYPVRCTVEFLSS